MSELVGLGGKIQGFASRSRGQTGLRFPYDGLTAAGAKTAAPNTTIPHSYYECTTTHHNNLMNYSI